MKRLFVLAAAVMLAAGSVLPAFAQTDMGPGIPAGATAPVIAGTSQDGAPVSFDTLKGDKGLVLAFVRSADWCPFCKEQLKDLNTIAGELENRGYRLAALSYDDTAKLAKFHRSAGLSYTLVSDPASAVIDAFGLRNMDVANNRRMNGIPHPAIYVIGRDGVVRAKLREEGYRDRPPAALVLETIDAMPDSK